MQHQLSAQAQDAVVASLATPRTAALLTFRDLPVMVSSTMTSVVSLLILALAVNSVAGELSREPCPGLCIILLPANRRLNNAALQDSWRSTGAAHARKRY